MNSNHSFVITGVSATERLPMSCSLLPDPSSRRLRSQHSLPNYPSTQFDSVPFAHEENAIMKKPLVSFAAVGSRTDHQFNGTWRRYGERKTMKILRSLLVVGLVVVAGRAFNAGAQTVTIVYSFGSSSNDGTGPFAGLVQGSDSNFYGTTQYGGGNGGGNGYGTVFRISPGGNYTSLYSFGRFPNDGEYPVMASCRATMGTSTGRPNTVERTARARCFGSVPVAITRISTRSPVRPKMGLVRLPGWCWAATGISTGRLRVEGAAPATLVTWATAVASFFGSVPAVAKRIFTLLATPLMMGNIQPGLVMGSDGNIYGTTGGGGTNNVGTVFRISSSGTYTILYSFGDSPTDGNGPEGLVEGYDSNFYGTTSQGGTNTSCVNGCGTVFRISPSGSYTSLYSFAGYLNEDGGDPQAGLVQGSDGNFYGTTSQGGTNSDSGIIFRISSSGSYTILHSFVGSAIDGAYPQAGLVQGSDGNFYGTTSQGGTSTNCAFGCGVVFELDVGLGPCGMSISATNAVFDAAGGSDSVSVTASNGCAWGASSNAGFITITSGSSGSGDGTVHYSVAANTGTNGLTGTMTIAGQTFTVTESGTTSSSGSCSYALSGTSVTLTEKGGKKTVSVKTKGTDCDWTASTTNSWITITSGSSGTGNGKVVYSIPGNTNTTPLSGAISIAGETYTVNQDAGGCTYKLSPKSGKLKAACGSATVKVTPNLSDCDWTAVSTNGFITITSGASGTGKGSVTYSVPANATSNVLTGSIAVAGQTFTVIQAGAK